MIKIIQPTLLLHDCVLASMAFGLIPNHQQKLVEFKWLTPIKVFRVFYDSQIVQDLFHIHPWSVIVVSSS